MPHSGHKGTRSSLADVLADIKNSRNKDDYEFSNHDYAAPTPAKRRSAVNYVALSGHTPRQSRSNTFGNSHSTSNNHLNHRQTPSASSRKRTYILKLFDRTIDLAPFSVSNKYDYTLYPICRSWLEGQKADEQCNHVAECDESRSPDEIKQQQQTPQAKSPSKSVTIKMENGSGPIESPSQDDLEEPIAVEVYSLPSPVSAAETNERFNLDKETNETTLKIPQCVRHFKPTDDLEETFDNSINTMNYSECLQTNKERWKKVRQDWSAARSMYEWRYEKSFKIINEIFKSHQRTG